MADPTIAYVSDGKLYTRDPQGATRLLDSPFVQTILDRVEKTRQRNEWKTDSMSWQSSRGFNPMMMQNRMPGELRRVRFAGVAAGASANEVLYAIDTDYVCGLFHHELAEGYERRLYHRNQFRASDLSRSPQTATLAFTVRSPDGTAHIATMAAEGKGFKTITEGDAVDEAPSWSAKDPDVLYFQSAGIGRSDRGGFTGLSTYAIHQLDLKTSRMEILIEDDKTDALSPRQAADGSLYFIRRPYEPFGPPVPFWRYMLDALLFPIGVIRAIIHFLDVFSIFFAKKPLITAGGPERDGPDQRVLMLYGQMLNAKKIRATAQYKKDGKLVPSSWQLIRKSPEGKESVLAKNVVAYDLCPAGGFVYTTGSALIYVDGAGIEKNLGKGELVERVTVLGNG